MRSKPDLRQAVNSLALRRQPEPIREPLESAAKSQTAANHYRPSREGKAPVIGYFPREVRKQIKTLAAVHETTIEDMLAEAMNDLFAKYGKPEIAPRKERLA